jgi:SPP1 gp7 family putative phage head morphogenesis protein
MPDSPSALLAKGVVLDIQKMEAGALKALANVMSVAQQELAQDLSKWVAKLGPNAAQLKYTAAHIKQVQMLLGIAQQQAKYPKAAFPNVVAYAMQSIMGGANAPQAAVATLMAQLDNTAKTFGGMPGPQLIEAGFLAKGDKLVLDQYKKSATKYAGQVKDDLKLQFGVGLAKGETVDQLVKRIAKLSSFQGAVDASNPKHAGAAMAAGLTKRYHNQAERLVRTELINAYNHTAMASIGLLAAYEDGVEARWDASLDMRLCLICKGLHDKRTKPGHLFPGGYARPPAHPNCRCAIVAWIDEEWKDDTDLDLTGIPSAQELADWEAKEAAKKAAAEKAAKEAAAKKAAEEAAKKKALEDAAKAAAAKAAAEAAAKAAAEKAAKEAAEKAAKLKAEQEAAAKAAAEEAAKKAAAELAAKIKAVEDAAKAELAKQAEEAKAALAEKEAKEQAAKLAAQKKAIVTYPPTKDGVTPPPFTEDSPGYMSGKYALKGKGGKALQAKGLVLQDKNTMVGHGYTYTWDAKEGAWIKQTHPYQHGYEFSWDNNKWVPQVPKPGATIAPKPAAPSPVAPPAPAPAPLPPKPNDIPGGYEWKAHGSKWYVYKNGQPTENMIPSWSPSSPTLEASYSHPKSLLEHGMLPVGDGIIAGHGYKFQKAANGMDWVMIEKGHKPVAAPIGTLPATKAPPAPKAPEVKLSPKPNALPVTTPKPVTGKAPNGDPLLPKAPAPIGANNSPPKASAELTLKEFERERKEFRASLTPEESAAALRYSSNDYGAWNASMRQHRGNAVEARFKESTIILDRALAKSSLPRDTTVFRGVATEPDAHRFFRGLKPGDVIMDHAYQSTSYNYAASFKKPVRLELTIPQGGHAAAIPSHYATEDELLLPRDQKMRIDRVVEKGGETVVYATAVYGDDIEAITMTWKR